MPKMVVILLIQIGVFNYKINFSFTSNGHLNIHMRSHLKNKQFKCVECTKKFYTSKDLKIHMMLHTNERPFVCSICNKGFNRLNNLTKHVRLHSGLKPHVCDVMLQYLNYRKWFFLVIISYFSLDL